MFRNKRFKTKKKKPFHSFAVTTHLFPMKQLAIYRIKVDKNNGSIINYRERGLLLQVLLPRNIWLRLVCCFMLDFIVLRDLDTHIFFELIFVIFL